LSEDDVISLLLFLGSWINPGIENEMYRRLGVGPLLGDILDRFTTHIASNPSSSNPSSSNPSSLSPTATADSPQKMALYGTHDTTIAALLSTLSVFDNKWPHFTSNITFELFKAKKREGIWGFLPGFMNREDKNVEFFVRTEYNQRVVELPGILSL
jgi:acid phosphatase